MVDNGYQLVLFHGSHCPRVAPIETVGAVVSLGRFCARRPDTLTFQRPSRPSRLFFVFCRDGRSRVAAVPFARPTLKE